MKSAIYLAQASTVDKSITFLEYVGLNIHNSAYPEEVALNKVFTRGKL